MILFTVTVPALLEPSVHGAFQSISGGDLRVSTPLVSLFLVVERCDPETGVKL